MKKYTIYQFTNTINNKKYIGITGIKYPSMRKGQHLFNLRKNKHCNTHLQSSFNKHGEINFVFSILESNLPKDEALEKERFYISTLNTQNREFGYNIEIGGTVTEISEETKNKIRKTLTGRIISEEQRKNHSELMKVKNPMTGKTHSEEAREKIRQAQLKRSRNSRLHSEETKRKISLANKGKVVSIETRQRLSNARKNKNLSVAQLDALKKAREIKNAKHRKKDVNS